MLKRYQVLLPEWLIEELEFYADKLDLSSSEIIRASICLAVLGTVPKQFPEFKPGVTLDDLVGLVKKYDKVEPEREEIHRALSKLYFEARKGVEYRQARVNKKKKK